jgi:magnesium chelatase family protein
MVVLACNPCPCGNYSPLAGRNGCICSELKRRDYRNRITGPVADRIDIVRHLVPLTPDSRRDVFLVNESSAQVRGRVEQARERQSARYAGASWRLNSQAPGPVLRERWPLVEEGQRLVDDEVYAGRLSQRGATRVHRLAWTLADLEGADRPGPRQVDVALRLRTGEPLMLATLERRVG